MPTPLPQTVLRTFALLAVLGGGLLAAAVPASGSERHPTLIELEGEVICPTCHTTLDQSDAPAARRIEAFMRRRIAAGDRKSEIKAKLVAQFGPAILAAPPRHGFDLLAWWLPIAGILVAAIVLAGAAYRWSRVRAPTPVAAAPEPLDPALERRLDDELARFG